ncbi:MAG: sugar phosphate isomerase/epimerase [Planctomycetota bacterium]
MKVEQIAAQLYTVRDYLKTVVDITTSLKKIRKIGYQAVQVSGVGKIDYAELAKILQDEGLYCCATHEDPQLLLQEPERIIERLQKLGCRMTACPSPGRRTLKTFEDVKDFASKLEQAGQMLTQAGITFCYHNHHIEFQQVDGKTILQMIYELTDHRYVKAEIDTYWVQYGGGDPASWCEKMRNRLPAIHLKDYIITPDLQPTHAEIGNGNLNWREIISAAVKSNCSWFIVEQDICPADPFDSLAKSFDYLAENFCS